MFLQFALAFLIAAVLFLGLVVLTVACIGTAFIWVLVARVYGMHHRRQALRELKKAISRSMTVRSEEAHLLAPVVIEPLRRENNGR